MALDANAIILALIGAGPPTLVALLALRRVGEVKATVATVASTVKAVKDDVSVVKVDVKRQREDLATTLNGVLKK